MITVPVELGDRSYDVLVGRGARHRLIEVLPAGIGRAAIVTQESIGITVDAGVEQQTFFIDDGEDAKCMETVEELCRRFSRWGLTRADVVVAVGGGVVTDTAGFAAAVYHRGVPVVHVSTSLLGQVDAAIGGKTGVNLREGKNLVGTFWQPAAVLCDTEVLETLPPREYQSGLGEMAKYHFIGGEGLEDLPLDEKVARCVAIKARYVMADEHERTGVRAILNYGHTLAHALETAGGAGRRGPSGVPAGVSAGRSPERTNVTDLRHGEAVAIGLIFAAELAARLERIGPDRVEEHRKVVLGYGLPDRLPPDADLDALITLMRRDKKATSGLTFVLDSPRGVEPVAGVDAGQVTLALEAVR